MNEQALKHYRRKASIYTKKMGDRHVIVPLQNDIAHMDKVYVLTDVAAFIWEQLDEQQYISSRQIAEAITAEFDVNKEKASSDLNEFLESAAPFIEKSEKEN